MTSLAPRATTNWMYSSFARFGAAAKMYPRPVQWQGHGDCPLRNSLRMLTRPDKKPEREVIQVIKAGRREDTLYAVYEKNAGSVSSITASLFSSITTHFGGAQKLGGLQEWFRPSRPQPPAKRPYLGGSGNPKKLQVRVVSVFTSGFSRESSRHVSHSPEATSALLFNVFLYCYIFVFKYCCILCVYICQ